MRARSDSPQRPLALHFSSPGKFTATPKMNNVQRLPSSLHDRSLLFDTAPTSIRCAQQRVRGAENVRRIEERRPRGGVAGGHGLPPPRGRIVPHAPGETGYPRFTTPRPETSAGMASSPSSPSGGTSRWGTHMCSRGASRGRPLGDHVVPPASASESAKSTVSSRRLRSKPTPSHNLHSPEIFPEQAPPVTPTSRP